MNLNVQSTLVTEGKEERLSGNCFRMMQDGYTLYPINTLIDLKRTERTAPIARIIIEEIQWKNNQTVITYEIQSLVSVN